MPRLTPGQAMEQLLDQLRPITLPKVVIPKARVSAKGLRRVLVMSDLHFPCQDDNVVAIALQMVRDWEPHLIVLNGDLPDMLAISKYPKDIQNKWPLIDERIAMWKFLVALHEAAPANTEIVETNANHSGNSPESRWRRYLSDRVGELSCLPEFVARTSYEAIWHPHEPWSRLRLVDYATLGKALIAVHGDIVRKNAGYSAKAMLEKYRVNLIHGHTHRMGSTGYRVPSIADQKSHQMRAYEGGCCCRLETAYGNMFDWQQGFCLGLVDDSTERFSIEQVLVHEGKAVSTTLGGSYRA